MNFRVMSFVLACICALPAVAAERPVLPARPTVTPPAAGTLPAFRVAPSDLPRAPIVRPEGAVVRPMLPTDARPIMPMLPGRPSTGAGVATTRPFPRPIEGRPAVPVRPAS
jgi:hypothetical protein